MKRIVAFIMLFTLCVVLVSCDIFGDNTDEFVERIPVIREDSAVIFGKNDAFDIVYSSDDASCKSVAESIASCVAALGFQAPKVEADNKKSENKCELLVGKTNREISTDAMSIIANKVKTDPNSEHWVWYYDDGQLALWANSSAAYSSAIAELSDKYFSSGEVKIKTDAYDVGYIANSTPNVSKDGSIYIFGSTRDFTVVYGDADETGIGATVASDLASRIEGVGIDKPDVSADNEKRETGCELLVGDTGRALSAKAKAALAEKIAEKPDDEHWIWLYNDGQLALWANNAYAYDSAISFMLDEYLKNGVIKVHADADGIGYKEARHLAYMSYDIPDNFFTGYTDPFGMADSDYKEMTLKKVSYKTYQITYKDDIGGTFTTSLVQRSWGTWAMGAWNYKSSDGVTHMISSSNTDYEFVLNIGAKTPNSFRSGNHGNYPGDKNWEYYLDDTSESNDRLLDMTFYDGKTGDKITLQNIGDSVVVSGLRIVMHHNIYELNYTQENVLINAERSYLYNGYDVMLDTKLYMTQDVNFSRSYSCMFPVSKGYGNYARFYLEDGSTYLMKTQTTSGGKDHLSLGMNATLIDLWGEQNPSCHVKISLNNREDQYKNSVDSEENGYAGIRDMKGGDSNKIYCSLFTESGTLRWGEELHFNTTWSFSYEPDFKNPTGEPDRWVGLDK